MIEIIIIKVEDSGYFWGRIKKGFSDVAENENQYERLEEKMNQLYQQNSEELEEIKLPVLEQGQICVIYCHELHCWCRAVLESIISSGINYLAKCFLVDYAKHILVKAKDVRRAVDTFWKLPYRAKKFTLFGIQPVTLNINICEEKAIIGPAGRWDRAAIQYFQKMAQESQIAEAKLKGIAGDTIAVQLYLTLKDGKVCMNDELVAKMFARYISPKNQNLVKSPNSSTLCMKNESPVKKTVVHKALALWSEILEMSTITEQNQGFSDQESVVQCLKDEDKNAFSKYVSKTPSSLHRRNSVEPLQSIFLSKMQSDENSRIDLRNDRYKSRIPSTSIQRSDEKSASTRLLQFLNPDPLNTEAVLHPQQPTLTNAFDQSNGLLVHSVIKLTPCTRMEMAPISLDLKKELSKKKIDLDIVQAYCWPAIGRGCDLVAVSQKGDNPLLYLPPLLTLLQLPSVYSFQPKRNLPVAIIVCPGQQKAHFVCQELIDLTQFSRPLNLSLLLVGQDPEESKKIKLAKGCNVVVTTPYSLVRILKQHCLFFTRLSHLILDGVDVLFNEAIDEMSTILQNFKEATKIPERWSTPQQLIAVGKHWTKEMEILIKENRSDPYVVITVMEEAALYGKVHQIVQLCLDDEKTSLLLTMLDFTSEILQKTLIFANCAEEVNHVFKALDSNSNFCIKVHEGMNLHLSQVLEQWNNKFSPGTHVILVTTDECLPVLGITDATCVIHYGFPPTLKIFGARLCCMVDNFNNLIVKESTPQSQSIILMTDKNVPQMTSLLQYLERTEANIPAELYKFISDLNDEDDICSDKYLCKYLKAYGICRDIKTCESRHKIHPTVDKPRCILDEKRLPSSGYVEIIPTYVSNASCYYGRIIHKRKKWGDSPTSVEDSYLRLLKDMAEYYMEENHRKPVEQLKVLSLYALKEKKYYRVQLIGLPQKDGSPVLSSAEVKYIDSGQVGHVMQKNLFELPTKFQVLPPQIVEFIVCNVKPIDHEKDWNPQVSRFIQQKIINKPHEAKIALALGNTLWLNPVVRLTKLPDLKTTIFVYNIRSEIMNSGYGTDNLEHIERLKDLCRAAGFTEPDKDSSQKKLSTLEDEINQKAIEKQDHIPSSYIPVVGDLCLALCTTNRWCRVRILSVDSSNKNCHVLFVDFGTYRRISSDRIQPLMTDVPALPFQVATKRRNTIEPVQRKHQMPNPQEKEQIMQTATCCSLLGINAVGKNWNSEIKELIWTSFQGKELQVKVIEQNRNESTSSLRTAVVEELKNLIVQYPAEGVPESDYLRCLWRLLRFLSTPKEQADLMVAMTHLAKMQVRVYEEVENQQTVSLLCEKVQQSSVNEVLEKNLEVVCHPSGRSESMNLMLANGIESTISGLLSSTSNESVLYEVVNKMKFSLMSSQNLHLQDDSVFSEGNDDIKDIPREQSSRSTTDYKSFHPEIKWHQTDDHLVLNIKLQNVAQYSCRFDQCRVIFSASVDAKLYLADMELQGSILKDKCLCIIKNEEPVITLFKEERGVWSSLLKIKNPNVTFDFNYFVESTDDVSLPIYNDIRRKEHQLVLEPMVDEWNNFTYVSDSSEEDY
ncbi:putative ATP-dependent RNA helicase TDRD12 isoform X2 [Mobula hypostoma]|uniref:putative ATP-dependent RNA helicase TDRD12 isoform X2 n=1 Tax=Mobula hypostoma TaxID=723540 RepID=UPI002FC3A532